MAIPLATATLRAIAGEYQLDSPSIFPQPRRTRFTPIRHFALRGRKPVHQSLGSLGAETRSPWRERPALQTRPAQTGIRARRTHANPIGLLAARYPATCRLVGRPSFTLAARRFMQSHPPERPTTPGFGDDFPRYVRTLGTLACIEYVADVAELEMLWHKAERIRSAPPAVTPIVSRLPGETLNRLRVVLHPSVCLLQSRFPIVTACDCGPLAGRHRLADPRDPPPSAQRHRRPGESLRIRHAAQRGHRRGPPHSLRLSHRRNRRRARLLRTRLGALCARAEDDR